MTVKRDELIDYLNQLLTPQVFEDYAPNGLQVEGKSNLKRLAFAVSATQDSLKHALNWNADALIVHHGILWKHQGARTITGPWGERVKLCVKHELNLIAYHLPLDAHSEVGNAMALGKQIGLTDFSPFAIYKKQPLGIKGKLSSPSKASELRERLKNILHHEVILASPNESHTISTIGIVTGGANNEWQEAMKDGLDAYLTGEISEYNWHDSIEGGIHYFAGGHHATERFGIIALMEKIRADFSVETKFFDSNNPA